MQSFVFNFYFFVVRMTLIYFIGLNSALLARLKIVCFHELTFDMTEIVCSQFYSYHPVLFIQAFNINKPVADCIFQRCLHPMLLYTVTLPFPHPEAESNSPLLESGLVLWVICMTKNVKVIPCDFQGRIRRGHEAFAWFFCNARSVEARYHATRLF